jgi:PqqD family protein of HPr-rel-A system
MSSESVVWRIVSEEIAWRELDGEIVVFSDATGNTHHLGAAASALLSTLVEHPTGMDSDRLLVALEQRIRAIDDKEIGQALNELERLHITTRVPV